MHTLTSSSSYKLLTPVLILAATVIFFIAFSSSVSAAACSSVSAGGSYTVSSSCNFSGTVDGVDNGGITVNSSQTLTVNAGQTIVWGPGQSIVINGSIALNSTGKLQQTRIWMVDTDLDGYASSTTQTAGSSSPGAGYRNRADLTSHTSADCKDDTGYTGAVNVYQDVASLRVDKDNDGYITSDAASTICVGASSTISGRTYYKSTANTFDYLPDGAQLSGTDLDDSDAGTSSYSEGYYYGQGYYYSQGTYNPDKTCFSWSSPNQEWQQRPALATACDSYCSPGPGTETCTDYQPTFWSNVDGYDYGTCNFTTTGDSIQGACGLNDVDSTTCSCG